MVDIMSLTKMGGLVALTVTPEDLHHFANALLAQSRKEWEEQAASVRKEESEETFLTTEDVCKILMYVLLLYGSGIAQATCNTSSLATRTCTLPRQSKPLHTLAP